MSHCDIALRTLLSSSPSDRVLARLGRQVGESRVHEFVLCAKQNVPCAQVMYCPAPALRTSMTESQPRAPIVCAPALSSRAGALVPLVCCAGAAAVSAADESTAAASAPVSFHGAAALMASEEAAGGAMHLGFSFGFGTLDAQPSSTAPSLPVPAYPYVSSSASASAFSSIASASGAATAQPTLQPEAAAAYLRPPSATTTTCQVVPPSPAHSAPHSGDTRTQIHMSHAPTFHNQPPSARFARPDRHQQQRPPPHQSPESRARNNINNSTRAPRHLEQAARRDNRVESGGVSRAQPPASQTHLPSRSSGPKFGSDGESYSGNRRGGGGYGERAPRRQQPPTVAFSRPGNGFRQGAGQAPSGASYAGVGGSGERERKPPPSACSTEWPTLAHSGDRR